MASSSPLTSGHALWSHPCVHSSKINYNNIMSAITVFMSCQAPLNNVWYKLKYTWAKSMWILNVTPICDCWQHVIPRSCAFLCCAATASTFLGRISTRFKNLAAGICCRSVTSQVESWCRTIRRRSCSPRRCLMGLRLRVCAGWDWENQRRVVTLRQRRTLPKLLPQKFEAGCYVKKRIPIFFVLGFTAEKTWWLGWIHSCTSESL